MAASATFALNAGLWLRRARLDIIAPDLRHPRPAQAEIPLIDLSEFAQPALSTWFDSPHNGVLSHASDISQQYQLVGVYLGPHEGTLTTTAIANRENASTKF